MASQSASFRPSLSSASEQALDFVEQINCLQGNKKMEYSIIYGIENVPLSGSARMPAEEEEALVSAVVVPEARSDVKSRCSLAAGLSPWGAVR